MPSSKVTACAICGSDLHIYNGLTPAMEQGDVIGDETMGAVIEARSTTGRTLIRPSTEGRTACVKVVLKP